MSALADGQLPLEAARWLVSSDCRCSWKRTDGWAYGDGREALLTAAVRVVARKGIRHLTYRALARQAGVTHGLVTYHFGSRDALIRAALQCTAR
jgi:AcrR family transcriptional regulator